MRKCIPCANMDIKNRAATVISSSQSTLDQSSNKMFKITVDTQVIEVEKCVKIDSLHFEFFIAEFKDIDSQFLLIY